MPDATWWILAAWLGWCLVNLLLMAMGTPHLPSFNGFRVSMPRWLHSMLTPEEFEAIRQHELGHQHHLHPWRNLWLRCTFRWPSPHRLALQELEADDFAIERVGPRVYATALAKMASNEFDRARVVRAETRTIA